MVEKSQQPVGHDDDVQTHWPAMHCWPAPHGELEPHWQAPLTQRSAVNALHVLQVPVVGEPQRRKFVVVVSHVDAELQQPVQPVVELHTHVADVPLPLQTVPVGQAAPVEPQTQPPLLHRFALVGSQVVQLLAPPPGEPQLLVSNELWQTLLASQQPFGHEVASQMQLPPEQRWPVAHTVPPGPHEQAPPTQRSALAPQATHAAPPVAQPTLGPGELQVLPAQQPVVQVVAQPAHAPLMQLSPLLHGVQALPPMPHWLVDGATQLPPESQQPLGHEVASQTHLPLEQRCPVGQAPPVEPHTQLPLTQVSESAPQLLVQAPPARPQLAVLMMTQPVPLLHELESQTQPVDELHTWLTPHCAPLQAQTPPEQVSLIAVQSRQLEPLPPHCMLPTVATQVVLSAQQPVQKRLVQTQLPPTHSRPAPHCALLPHLQTPLAQLSALPAAHGTQAVPSVAQPTVGVGVVQV